MSFLNENVVLIAAVILIAASIPVVFIFDRAKSADHIARSLVAMGVGLLAAFVAVTVFELNAQKLEADRNLVLQQAKRSKTLALVSNLPSDGKLHLFDGSPQFEGTEEPRRQKSDSAKRERQQLINRHALF